MNRHWLIFLAVLPLQAQAFEPPDIRVFSDCTATVSMSLPNLDSIEVVSSEHYPNFNPTAPMWAAQTSIARVDDHVQIRGDSPLPAQGTGLILKFHTTEGQTHHHMVALPPCQPPPAANEGERIHHDVNRGDTLYEISLQYYRQLDVSVNTLMLALQSYNRGAFLSGNINLLRADRDLSIPSRADIAQLALNAEYVTAEVTRQHTSWRQFKRGEISRTSLRSQPLKLLPIEQPSVPSPANDTAPVATAATENAPASSSLEPATPVTRSQPPEVIEPAADNAATETASPEKEPDTGPLELVAPAASTQQPEVIEPTSEAPTTSSSDRQSTDDTAAPATTVAPEEDPAESTLPETATEDPKITEPPVQAETTPTTIVQSVGEKFEQIGEAISDTLGTRQPHTVLGLDILWVAIIAATAVIALLYLAVVGIRRYRHHALIRNNLAADPLDVGQHVASMLDLARAHIEMGNPELAEPFIETALTRGSPGEREEAEHLRARCQKD